MDFLDPKKRKRHQIRLMIGYALMAIVILLTAKILVTWAYGYGFDTKTGQVIENGLLFVDSKPGGADIYLNNSVQSRTSARLVLQDGNYDLRLQKDGYRPWQKKLVLTAHEVERIVYPLLIPKTLTPKALKTYPSPPSFFSVSLDHHWLMLQPISSPVVPVFEIFDISKNAPTAANLQLPDAVVSNINLPGQTYQPIEWAADNNHLLIRHAWQDGQEFILLNRSDPATSVNLNKLFNANPDSISLDNKQNNLVYLYSASGLLQRGDIGRGSLQTVLDNVLAYKSIANNLVFYVSSQAASANQVTAKIFDGSKSYSLANFDKATNYLIAAVQYQSDWYYAAGSDKTERINIYKNPLDGLKNPAVKKARPLISLTNGGATTLTVSDNGRFIASQSSSRMAVYDLEEQSRYQYPLPVASSAGFDWVDGHRFMTINNGSLFIFDFDNQNGQTLIPAASLNVTFDKDTNRMFSLATAADAKSIELQMTDLRAGSDLPK